MIKGSNMRRIRVDSVAVLKSVLPVLLVEESIILLQLLLMMMAILLLVCAFSSGNQMDLACESVTINCVHGGTIFSGSFSSLF